jgi:hypothetical protein
LVKLEIVLQWQPGENEPPENTEKSNVRLGQEWVDLTDFLRLSWLVSTENGDIFAPNYRPTSTIPSLKPKLQFFLEISRKHYR